MYPCNITATRSERPMYETLLAPFGQGSKHECVAILFLERGGSLERGASAGPCVFCMCYFALGKREGPIVVLSTFRFFFLLLIVLCLLCVGLIISGGEGRLALLLDGPMFKRVYYHGKMNCFMVQTHQSSLLVTPLSFFLSYCLSSCHGRIACYYLPTPRLVQRSGRGEVCSCWVRPRAYTHTHAHAFIVAYPSIY